MTEWSSSTFLVSLILAIIVDLEAESQVKDASKAKGEVEVISKVEGQFKSQFEGRGPSQSPLRAL